MAVRLRRLEQIGRYSGMLPQISRYSSSESSSRTVWRLFWRATTFASVSGPTGQRIIFVDVCGIHTLAIGFDVDLRQSFRVVETVVNRIQLRLAPGARSTQCFPQHVEGIAELFIGYEVTGHTV